MSSLALRSSSPEETRRLAAALAGVLEAGDVVALCGELGAGKTCFVQGLARGLGVREAVTSPTFVLMKLYEGRLPLVHCDVYRLATLADVHDLGEDVMAPDAVTVIEWGDSVRSVLPDERLEVDLTHGDDDQRGLALRATGHAWARRCDQLAQVCDPWRRPSC